MKKAAFLLALFVGYWFISYNAIAHSLTIDSLMYGISCAHNEILSPCDNKGDFTGFSEGHFWNVGANVDSMGNDTTNQYDNFLFRVNAQMPEAHELDGTSNAIFAPEPTTMFLFGVGLVLLAGSGRKLKKRVSVSLNRLNSPFLMPKKSYSAFKTPAFRGGRVLRYRVAK
ncbi:MAG: PEP-CTERM sorting domain-containing protein [Deltaproteobacteria bacterium]|nr:PEP-CTERM sorting domain-containing protein [Deltaproteobacteria bacterium]